MSAVTFIYAASLGILSVVIRRPFYELLKARGRSTPDLFWESPLILGLFYFYSRHKIGSRQLDLIAVGTEVGSAPLLVAMTLVLIRGMTGH